MFSLTYQIFTIMLTSRTQSTDNRLSIIFWRPFLAIAKARIDRANGTMTLAFGNLTAEVNVFNLMRQQEDLRPVTLNLTT